MKLISTLFAFCMALPAAASGPSAVILCKDGSAQEMELSTLLRMELDGDKLTSVGKDGSVSSVDIKDIDRISLGSSAVIPSLPAETIMAAWPSVVTDNTVLATIPTPGGIVTVTDINGLSVTATADENGSARINIGSLAPGVIFVKAGNNTIKLIKKN